ncbi:hypothetical protein ACE1TF_08980 [Geomicrobium sp. JSM 1781026]|uniref:hypothetical protein n=1 Tax=unclassified Geomicrobium TaxID=2628951 RepID=UPI00045F16B1|nr:hypothetical protein [Geomicrobium sp. JCM 19039]GAK13722.1 hypothetical protein JCM19039_3589 [Geomicrobium sp. JCM 19039]
MELLPFQNTWPYDRIGGDVYFDECPKCNEPNVLTYMKQKQLRDAFDGVKTTLILPCCNYSMVIMHADDDYFWTTERLRK